MADLERFSLMSRAATEFEHDESEPIELIDRMCNIVAAPPAQIDEMSDDAFGSSKPNATLDVMLDDVAGPSEPKDPLDAMLDDVAGPSEPAAQEKEEDDAAWVTREALAHMSRTLGHNAGAPEKPSNKNAKRKTRAAAIASRHAQRFPEMSASIETYYSRPRPPFAMKHFKLPVYMRALECRLIDTDEANSALELFVLGIRHLDIKKAFGQSEFVDPYALMLPQTMGDVPGKPTDTTIEFIVLQMRDNAGINLKPNQGKAYIESLNKFYFGGLYHGCLAMHHPQELAAAILVAFQLFNCFTTNAAGVRAGAFIANAILMAEGFAPLREADIKSIVLETACQKDATTWYNQRGKNEFVPECTHAFIRTLKRVCHVCGGVDSNGRVTRCSQCHYTYYCSVECQKLDYFLHDENGEKVLDYNVYDANGVPTVDENGEPVRAEKGKLIPLHKAFCVENVAAKKNAAKQGQ